MVTAYVLGFAFNTVGDRVALIRKNKPDWQKGFLNGIGGKIEKDESKREAMVREFEEECGIKTSTYNWTYYGDMISDKSYIALMRCSIPLDEIKSLTDEEVILCNPFNLPKDVIYNLRYLVPLAYYATSKTYTLIKDN